MSPRPRHIPNDAQRTTICLTAEENAAINWISQARRMRKDGRRTKNDILVDALWYFFEKTEGKTRDQIRALVPSAPPDGKPQSKVTEMPKPKPSR
ncbi:MAG: hypothetical protein WA399_20985 [Acidobacteriaceae bacterium]